MTRARRAMWPCSYWQGWHSTVPTQIDPWKKILKSHRQCPKTFCVWCSANKKVWGLSVRLLGLGHISESKCVQRNNKTRENPQPHQSKEHPMCWIIPKWSQGSLSLYAVWHSPNGDKRRGSPDHLIVWGGCIRIVMGKTFQAYTRFIWGEGSKVWQTSMEK